MIAGYITVDGKVIGTIEADLSDDIEFTPNVEGYVPEGRAEAGMHGSHREEGNETLGGNGGGGHSSHRGHTRSSGGGTSRGGHSSGGRSRRQKEERPKGHRNSSGYSQEFADPDEKITPTRRPAPEGREYNSDGSGRPVAEGSEETDRAIRKAADYMGRDPNFMRSIASIESGMVPSSNSNRSTQYKGLYQIGRNEWARFGQGNIYSAEDNAMGAARLFKENSKQFAKNFGREPTEPELYMLHQQGLGFYTRGAMTNIKGNPYPGMRGPQTHESFEAGWGREIARRKAAFARQHGAPTASAPSPTIPQTTSNPPVLKMPEDL